MKTVVVVGGLVLGVGALLLFASTSKASPKSASPFQYGQGTTVQGRSGAAYLVARVLNPGPVAPGVNVMAVFPMNTGPQIHGGNAGLSDPVLLFAQRGDDENSRTLVSQRGGPSANLQVDDTLQIARLDFGV